MDILTKQCPTVQRLNYRRNILSETTTRMKKSPPSSQSAAWERRRLLDTCDRRQQQQQLVVIVVLPPSRAPSEAWGRLRNMHTNDNDSSTLVASPVTAGPLGEGGGKSAFSIERTATETRKRKGHECETVAEPYARDASQIVLPPSVYKDTPQTRLSSARGVAVGAKRAMAKRVKRVKRIERERERESYIYRLYIYNRTCRRVCTFFLLSPRE